MWLEVCALCDGPATWECTWPMLCYHTNLFIFTTLYKNWPVILTHLCHLCLDSISLESRHCLLSSCWAVKVNKAITWSTKQISSTREQPAYNQIVHMLQAWFLNTILLVKRANINSKFLHGVPRKTTYQSPLTLWWWGPTLVEGIIFHAHSLSGSCQNFYTNSILLCFVLSGTYPGRTNVTS